MEGMVRYFEGDVKRINHLLKVYGFAKTIGELEGLDEKTQEILEMAAITHDIGIKISEKKHNSASGYYQQMEGPNEAKILLEGLEIENETIERICWLIAHHHTYHTIAQIDYQILVEADFLVNAWEDSMEKTAIISVRNKVFRTEAGKRLFDSIYRL